jgi:predicted dehydrogenase
MLFTQGSWWDKTQSGGPVVEQGTHFCDLSRFFGGDVDLATVKSVCVGASEEVGKLAALPVDENTILPENRIPRFT